MRLVSEIVGTRELYNVRSDWSLRRVVEYLCERKVGAVPVLDASELVGVFSERDLMSRVVMKGVDIDATPVSEVMTKEVLTIAPDEHYQIAKGIMVDKGIRHLVVQDADGKVHGFLSLRELSEIALEEANALVGKLNADYYNEPNDPS